MKNEGDTLGAQIDHLTKLKQKHTQAQRKADAVEAEVKTQEAAIFAQMRSQKVERAGGKTATLSIQQSLFCKVVDWDAFYAYIRRNKAFHLLHRRVSTAAWQELMALKKKVPGTEGVQVQTLHYKATKA